MLKKIFTGLVLLLTLTLAAIYILIPTDVYIAKNIAVNTTDAHVFQFLAHEKEWKKWWPGTTATDFKYQYRNNFYNIKKMNNDAVMLTISNSQLLLNTKFSFIATDFNKVKLNWNAVKINSLNPIERFNTYFLINKIEKDLSEILLHFKKFVENDRNIYQINISVAKVRDPIILATNLVTSQYPETSKIYELVAKLQQEIRKQHAAQTGAPMLNVHYTDLNKYEVMVGIPVNKAINPPKNMLINKMVLGGNILETAVKGGLGTARNAFNQLEKYKKDHNLISPAMPFESLITNRFTESDTTKWVTKIYYPIF